MRAVISGAFIIGIFMGTTALAPVPAHAVCKTMQASHNGTDMFHETGAVGAAVNKLLNKVETIKAQNSGRRVRMGRVRTKCSDWFMKYLLPHRHCVAKARVCY